jgi:hypothetical protein
MKLKAILLATTLLFTVPAQAATLLGLHTFTQTATASFATFGLSIGTFITQHRYNEQQGRWTDVPARDWLVVSAEANIFFTRDAAGNLLLNYGPPIIRSYGGPVSFTVLDDRDFFTFQRDSSGWGSDLQQHINHTVNTIETPLPAALPLFAAGLGLLGWLGLRRLT